jgi:hypothetical protein|tara:strand:- start:2974 stop:3549 length:576 start_codon:yes stop_codon:yes gene_type:complete
MRAKREPIGSLFLLNTYMKKKLALLGLFCFFAAITGCGVVDPAHKTRTGFYVDHYTSCGPVTLVSSLSLYSQKEDVVFDKELSIRNISQNIQSSSPPLLFNTRKLLTYINKAAAEITWPHEMERVCEEFGVRLTKVSKEELHANTDNIYIVLVHKKYSIYYYHWLCYPYTSYKHYGDGTVIDIVYKLEPLE